MQFKFYIKSLTFILCLLVVLCLCACKPYIDQDFVNLNEQSKTTEPNDAFTTPATPSPEPTNPEPTNPTVKPGGFELIEPETTPLENNNTPSIPNPDNNESTEPSNEEQLESNDMSSGLKTALSFLGSTMSNGDLVTLFHPQPNESGGIIIFQIIKQDVRTAEQTKYIYYEINDDFEKAIIGLSETSYDRNLHLVRHNASNITPVTNPETLSLVLFSGYVLWR